MDNIQMLTILQDKLTEEKESQEIDYQKQISLESFETQKNNINKWLEENPQ